MDSLLKRYMNPVVSSEDHTAADSADVIQGEATLTLVEELQQADELQKEVLKDADAFLDATTALETYQTLLSDSLNNGGLSRDAVKFMHMGIEQYSHLLGLDAPLCPSIESFNGSAGTLVGIQVSSESISDFLKKTWDIIKAMLKEIWAGIKDMYVRYSKGFVKAKTRANEISKRIETMGDTPRSREFIIANPAKVMTGAVYKGNRPGIIEMLGLSETLLKTFPDNINTHASNYATKVKELDPSELTDALIDELGEVGDIDKVFGGGMTFSSEPSGHGIASRSETLIGNKAVFITGTSRFAMQSTSIVTKGVNVAEMEIKIADDMSSRSTPATYQTYVLSPTHLREQVKLIQKLTQKCEQYMDESSRNWKYTDAVIKAGDAFKAKASKIDLTSDQQAMVRRVVKIAPAYSKAISGSTLGFLSYLVSWLNAQLSVIERQVVEYEQQSV